MLFAVAAAAPWASLLLRGDAGAEDRRPGFAAVPGPVARGVVSSSAGGLARES